MLRSFPNFKQLDTTDCGPTCLRIVAKHFGRDISLATLRQYCQINKDGVNLLGISEAAEKTGFRSLSLRLSADQLANAELPCILHWKNNHFVVLYKVYKGYYYISDPSGGIIKLNKKEFISRWGNKAEGIGIALMLDPSPAFFQFEDDQNHLDWRGLFKYLIKYRKLILQLLLSLAIGTVLQLIFPFLTQAVVDIGVNTKDLNFIYIIVIAQSALILGRVSVEFLRSWILLHVSTRINLSILTDFLIKLMRLPMSFFDTKKTGDIMQRMSDQRNIEVFLTGSALNLIFSVINLIVFSIVLVLYNVTIFIVFFVSGLAYLAWISLFFKSRRELNYKSFDISSKTQSNVVQLVTGMQEIKLNNCERQKRWEWERLQAVLFKFNVKNLSLSQYQQGGSMLINEGKNLIITGLSAKAVIDGHLTLGGMVAIQYIIGQLNGPIEQMLGFIRSFQDARISLERLNDIQGIPDEEPAGKQLIYELPSDKTIRLNGLSFTYPGAGNEPVLKEVNLIIPAGKTTAIVGMSGSGKTTLLKLLLGFYDVLPGSIMIGDTPLKNLSYRSWRGNCGVVMQDGFIFSDTIANNIAVGEDQIDKQKLWHAINVANINDLIEGLPLGIDTLIGAEGNGISQGQRQRLLIARAVYKNPSYIFFDEATNALDSRNERVIMDNMLGFFKSRTVVVVAHRLSTVSDADKIVVLDKGIIIEEGTHKELIAMRGEYYKLVKNQLSLGE
ncbi:MULTISPECIES: peptidase domain-containing ABC transporter [unclassified Mucilaginibacter]|uniref:peptidase domain-containing ABC transporter n=1 Tax=unclassified Mucilaginibacter TaxID=2617802 RepID=UPI002AC99D28|nr:MULTISPECIES: peptidase domain-containing ABC transporter [unclassified Mucilaginibacter]MEB0263194.1 peptidase domain-containing ABC transporter [Mucilaginibacter sp. 10I4]MEB0280094.1 peptidase domain-containing ABC transporter [Mucilaginibacter sp. 10B2]MEB0301070.1 peptidase domain-containing ABC transporter [Mucilaginibacter sp. 5C4]WPX24497.1 peptidase domain-containing ABC transporter [Mucilaginibacter sp. 5C4]